MENPLADLVESQLSRTNPRMTFVEMCAFHAAMALGVRNEAIIAATGLSSSVVTYLRHAGEHLGGQIRYPAVARERHDLGDQEFYKKYLTPPVRDRLAAAIDQVRLKQTTPKPPGAVRPNAKRFAGHHQATEYGGSKWEFDVRLSTEPPVGWLWGTTLEPGRGRIRPEHIRWQGDPKRQGRGYATSTEAYSAFINMINPKD